MSLTDDLLRLKELDPATYGELQDKFTSLDNYIKDKNFDVILDETIERAGNPAMWIIQGVLQEAIASHKWPIIIAFDCDPDSPLKWEVEICSGEVNGALGSAKADAPAAALLAAYIVASEVQT